MNLANRVFKNNKTGDTIRVIDSFENIAILENKQKIDVRTLMDSNQYTEQIDPQSFFNNQNAYDSLVNKIKSMPTDHIQDDPQDISQNLSNSYVSDSIMPTTNESAIVMSSEEDERAELMKKYGVVDNSNDIQRQNEAFSKLLDEEELPIPVSTRLETEEVQRFEVNREPQKQVVNVVEDPIITMFRKTKRNVEFKINIEVSNKIPRLDFIEMMEDSYEISMIDFLADEFTNKILQDPTMIKETIKNKIKQLVYGAPTTLSSNNNKTNKEEKKTEKDSKNIQAVNDQITDAVTQFEKHEPLSFEKEPVLSKDLPKKTTRKPRTKKESTEK
jgi:hypothetical protein